MGAVRSAPSSPRRRCSSSPGRTNVFTASPPPARSPGRRSCRGRCFASPVIDRNGHIYVGLSQAPRGMPPRGAGLSGRQQPQSPLGVSHRCPGRIDARHRRRQPDLLRRQRGSRACHRFLRQGPMDGRCRLAGAFRRHVRRAASPGLRAGQRFACRVGLCLRRPGGGGLAQVRQDAGAERNSIGLLLCLPIRR